mgnify:CR=1 FL=1
MYNRMPTLQEKAKRLQLLAGRNGRDIAAAEWRMVVALPATLRAARLPTPNQANVNAGPCWTSTLRAIYCRV